MKKIFCFYLKKINYKNNFRVYPGKLGEKIFKKISKCAWGKWLKKQTVLINENNFNMSNNKDIKNIEYKMINFLFKK
ncbi:MAG: oxidative damage protection protein [Enterobacteriaceae bacterium PSpicST1]|nr:MAG: oxidative damage protection protein [Enterobacteriaceae bacterium PSpicST1]